MKTRRGSIATTLTASLMLTFAGAALSADDGVTPAVQRVSVKGVAHFDLVDGVYVVSPQCIVPLAMQ